MSGLGAYAIEQYIIQLFQLLQLVVCTKFPDIKHCIGEFSTIYYMILKSAFHCWLVFLHHSTSSYIFNLRAMPDHHTSINCFIYAAFEIGNEGIHEKRWNCW